jgi:hypothetical protein
MDLALDPADWAEQTFGAADLGDPRRTRRLVAAAARIAAQPGKAFPQVFDWNDLRAFYRLCDQAAATLGAVMGPHWDQTRRAMGEYPVVLVVHDTTELDYSTHRAMTGIGQIGNERGRGLLQHNSLAVVPGTRRVLGLAYQQLVARAPAPAGESTYRRKRRPRESDLWPNGFRAPGRPPAGCRWVDVGDRGADDYEGMRAARDAGHDFLIRVNQNRRVFVDPGHGRADYVRDYARSLAGRATDVVDIPGRGGRAPRTARVSLAGAAVWIPAPVGTPRRKTQPVLPAWVIRVWEPDPPAGAAEPLEWILWCSVPTATAAELTERRDWYGCRWLAEVYHDVEKNGCAEEDRRFETADRMAACLAVLSVVAVRVLQLRSALDHQPDAPAEAAGSPAEVDVVRRLIGHPGPGFTVRQFVYGVARLGGFLGRAGDGDPGVRAIWRGYQRLQDMLAALRLFHGPAEDSG